MSIPAFNGSLSMVFLESAQHSAVPDAELATAQTVWDQALKQSGVKPFFTAPEGRFKKDGASSLELGDNLSVSVSAKTEISFPAMIAAFENARDARIFHDALNAQLESAKAHHAYREGARLYSKGTVTALGYQP
ncbi:MAG TPA: hypothetical protein VL625_01665 [Patescibacteria group bacterium]|nr:hypothetical protein [Patescibacteria group bacterium]